MGINKFYQEYQQKLKTPEEAVKLVKDGDWIEFTSGTGCPYLLDQALAKRKGELKDVKLRASVVLRPIATIEQDPLQESFTYHSWHCSGYERKLCDRGLCYYSPMLFRHLASYYRRYIKVNVMMMSVAPMDEKGYFSYSLTNYASRAMMEMADIVILEVDENLPNVYGGMDDCVHISEVDAVVEGAHPPLAQLPPAKETETDVKIAKIVMDYLTDGAVLQLGIGGLPNSVGKLIADSDLKHLGMHTELMSDGFVDLYDAGKLDHSKKTLHKNKGVFGIAMGTQRLYDWVKENRGILSFPMDYVNSPEVMAKIDNLISINSCIAVDLYGQVSSESSGIRHISGTGGQLDFTTGAYESPGGKGFICMNSTYKDKEGKLCSRIMPRFTGGDIITTPRTQSAYLVTEFGCVCLSGLSTWERAESLISIAHPDFRDALIQEAEKQKIWRQSNKI